MLARGRTRVKLSAAPWRLGPGLRWLPAAAWMGGIFYLSHQSRPLGTPASSAEATGAHILLYAVLAALLFWALHGLAARPARVTWLVAAFAFALAVLYGAVDELHQAFVAGRQASEADLALDGVGALSGALLARAIVRLTGAVKSRTA